MKSQKRNIETPIKSWFFEIDKITEPVARLITKKKKKKYKLPTLGKKRHHYVSHRC